MFKQLREFFRARAERRYRLKYPFRLLPTDDGGSQSFRQECYFCKEEGNVMSQFVHAPDCPAHKEK